MAPSTTPSKSGQKTPTKIARRGQQGGSSKAPSTPQPPKAQRPDDEEDDKTPEPSKVEMKDDDDDDKELTEQDPEPIDDSKKKLDDTKSKASDAKSKAGDIKSKADDTKSKVTESQDDESEDPEDTGDDLTEKAGDTAVSEDNTEDAESKADKATGGAKKAGSKAAGAAKNLGKGDTDGAADDAEDAADDTKDAAEDATEGAKDTAEDATGQDLDVPGLELLKGLEVDDDGLIHDNDGNAIGRLVEGDAEDLAGYEIGDEGEILDEDGDLVGRCELLPEKQKELIDQAKQQAEGAGDGLPGLEILKGLTVDAAGNILNDDGDTVGQLVEGDPKKLQGRTLNEKGEFLDDDGNVIGRAEVHPDVADLEQYQQDAEDTAEDAEGAAEDAGEGAGEEVEQQVEETGEAVDQELPGIEALEGHQVDEAGNVIDEKGNIIGELAEGDIEKVKGMSINEKGEVLDEDGNVIGKVNLADGAPEILAGLAPDLRILEGLKVNKKGKVLDEEGDEIGELIDGDPAECAGKKINDKGEVLDKQGKTIGRVKVTPGEAADTAWEILKEKLGETEETTPNLDILDGLKVNKKGQILNEDGEPIGELVDGDIAKCAGQKCNDKGEVLNDKGKVIGRVRTLPQAAEDVEEGEGQGEGEEGAEGEEGEEQNNLPPLSILEGLKVNKAGKLIDSNGNVVGELVEGDAKKLSKLGITSDDQGQFWDNKGHVIGRAQTVAQEDAEEESPFAGLEGLIVNKDGYVEDENGNVVGQVVDGDAKKLVGRAVDEDGDIIDKRGTVVGHAERWEPQEEEEEEEEAPDLSILAGKTVNKQGNVIGDDGVPIGRLVEGNAKDLAGRKCDENGLIYNDTGKQVGRCELIPENERVERKEGPFGGFEGLHVVKDGKVEDEDGNVVGIITEGDPKKLIGHSVDEDGDIVDKYGNVKGHAEPYEEPEEGEPDLSILAGCTVNKSGNVVDGHGNVVGRVAEGDPKSMIGRKVDGKGQIWDNGGNVIGRAEVVTGQDTSDEGPFAGFDNNTVAKDGTVQTQDGTIIGRIIEGDVKKLVGHTVDEDGDITDKNGNTIGKAERWEPEEKERRINPMSGMRVNKEGEVRDENGDIVGRLTAGDLGHCVGLEIDDNGYVIDNDGNRVGEVTLIENIQDEEEETDEDKKKKEDAELADKMSNICQQTLERIQPIMKQITEYIEQADRTPREELDEEELVNNVKPLIEEGGRILQECNGSLRGLDPDGRIAAQAKGRAQTRDATPEEYRLADLLKELTTNVVTTIDNAKKKISDMPHAKKKLNPLWSLLTEPLFQIIAAVGLLLAGVLGLVGQLLSALGLGGLVNGLLGGLGIKKLLGGLGLGGISDALGGGKDKKKKKGGASSIPLVGGLIGGGK